MRDDPTDHVPTHAASYATPAHAATVENGRPASRASVLALMKQVWIPKIGKPEVLEVRETADPEPGDGQVRVRVRAAGINFADIMARMGLYPDAPKLPAVVGYEVSGVVDRLGRGVSGVS